MTRITIIGAGPGGYAAAFEAARAGASVTLVEAADLGGTCLNSGCIPTKTMKASAEALETAKRLAEFGVTAADGSDAGTAFSVAIDKVVERKNRVRTVLNGGLAKACANLKIRVLYGTAALGAPSEKECEVIVQTADGTETVLSDSVIIATGSRCMNLPSLPVDHTHIITSDDALNLTSIPKRLVIVGGGVIGCEFAFIFRAFGSEVTVVEGQSRLLPIPSVDDEMSKLLQREAKKHGLKVELGKTVKSVSINDGKVTCVLAPSPFLESAPANDAETTCEADMVLVAVGRTANSENLGLKTAGVETDDRGWIKADSCLKTTAKNIYAIGDILGPSRIMLAHAASAEGLCAVSNCLGKEKHMDYSVVPSGIFTTPEIGTVGISEAEAKKQGLTVRSSTFQFRELGKAQAMGELPGMFKIVCEEESGRILGVHIAGAHATDLIAEAALAIKHGMTAQQIAETIHAHPTLAEGLYEAAEAWVRG